jgi:hypothetical protein
MIQLSDDQFTKLQKSVERIELALIGDECAGIEGLIKRVERHEKSINNGQKIIWLVLGGGSVITIAWNILKDII